MTDQPQRVAIVTGASRGIGAAIARRLAQDHFAVTVNFSRSRREAEAVVAAIETEQGRAIACEANVADRNGIRTLFDATEAAFGGIDVLVNNAGMMRLAPLAEVQDEQFDQQLALNLGAVFRGMREAARRMRDGGRIISFSSSVVGLYQPTYGVYAATKAGIEAMTHILAKELGKRGITVNAVAPGPVETELFLQGKSEEQLRAIAGMNPFGRVGRPDEIASVVAFLASPEAGWISGQTVRANGGVI